MDLGFTTFGSFQVPPKTGQNEPLFLFLLQEDWYFSSPAQIPDKAPDPLVLTT